jgi:hypothetical protein
VPSVVLADNLLTWGPAAWGAILGLVAAFFSFWFGLIEAVWEFFSRQKEKKNRIKMAREKGGEEAVDELVRLQKEEAEAVRSAYGKNHTRNAIVEGLKGPDKADQVKFKIFVVVLAVLVVLAIVQSI